MHAAAAAPPLDQLLSLPTPDLRAWLDSLAAASRNPGGPEPHNGRLLAALELELAEREAHTAFLALLQQVEQVEQEPQPADVADGSASAAGTQTGEHQQPEPRQQQQQQLQGSPLQAAQRAFLAERRRLQAARKALARPRRPPRQHGVAAAACRAPEVHSRPRPAGQSAAQPAPPSQQQQQQQQLQQDLLQQQQQDLLQQPQQDLLQQPQEDLLQQPQDLLQQPAPLPRPHQQQQQEACCPPASLPAAAAAGAAAAAQQTEAAGEAAGEQPDCASSARQQLHGHSQRSCKTDTGQQLPAPPQQLPQACDTAATLAPSPPLPLPQQQPCDVVALPVADDGPSADARPLSQAAAGATHATAATVSVLRPLPCDAFSQWDALAPGSLLVAEDGGGFGAWES